MALLRAAEVSPAGRGPRPIRLDDVTAGLLELRFEIGGEPGAPELVGERSAEEVMRTLLGKPTPCVGRQRELAVLEGLWQECLAESLACAVLVTGAAGMGKSRLRWEFVRNVRRLGAQGGEATPEVWIAQGDPLRASSQFGMAGQLVRRAAGLLEGESLAGRQRKLAGRVALHVGRADRARVTAFLGELVSTSFPDEDSAPLRAARRDPLLMGEQMMRAFEDFVAAEREAHPLLVVLEDLHWGDAPSVKLVEAALRAPLNRPLMVLALARPEVRELFPKLWNDINAHEIGLMKLSRKASKQLARDVLGERVPEERIERVVEQAGGNALYLEELIRAVAEGAEQASPKTLLAMMQSRLEALEPEARQIMRASSVFGEVFWAEGTAALVGAPHDARSVTRWLATLSEREFVLRREESRFPGQTEYMFRHALVRDAAYAMLVEQDRVLGHRLAGGWLERMGEQDAVALAEHFERGGDKPHAAFFYQRAAEQALEASDLGAVLARTARAIACGAEGELLGAVYHLEAQAHFWHGEFMRSTERYAAAMQLLPRASSRWFRVIEGAAMITFQVSQPEHLVVMAEGLRQTEVVPAALPFQIVATAQVARQLLRCGMTELAEPLFTRLAEVRGEAARDPAALGHLQAAFAMRALFAGDPLASQRAFEASIENFMQAGDMRYHLLRRLSIALTRLELGELERAEAELREVLAAMEQKQLRNIVPAAKCRLGWVLALRGTLHEARALEQEACAYMHQCDARWYESIARRHLAWILAQMGELAPAEDAARRSVALCNTAPHRCPALATLGHVLLRQGRAHDALAAAGEAMGTLERLGGIEEGEAFVRLTFVEALHATGDLEGAHAAIAHARARLLERAARIDDADLRQSFLERVPENARTLELARQWDSESLG